MDLSVIIVNWNTRDLLRTCLRLLAAGLDGLDGEVIVVDNDSEDDSVAMLREEFPHVVVIENEVNVGFARANNQAFEVATGRYLLLLNSDVEVTPEAIPGAMLFLDGEPKAAAAGIQLFFPDGKKQNSFDNFPTIAQEILNKSLLRLLFPSALPSKNQERSEPLPVDIIIGAFFLVRREVLEKVGPFDESFFLFMEEADWCKRMHEAGWQLYHLPQYTAIHHHGASKRKLEAASWIEYYRSTYIYFRKHRGLVAYAWLRILRFFKIFVNLALTALGVAVSFGGKPAHRKKFFIYLQSALWHLALCPENAGLRKHAVRRKKRLPDPRLASRMP